MLHQLWSLTVSILVLRCYKPSPYQTRITSNLICQGTTPNKVARTARIGMPTDSGSTKTGEHCTESAAAGQTAMMDDTQRSRRKCTQHSHTHGSSKRMTPTTTFLANRCLHLRPIPFSSPASWRRRRPSCPRTRCHRRSFAGSTVPRRSGAAPAEPLAFLVALK